MMEKTEIQSGQILLAEPFMRDPYFRKAVVLLCEHSEHGTQGFILNKQLDVEVKDLLYNFPDISIPMFYGGPVHTHTIHFLHRFGDIVNDSQQVCNGVFWGGDFNQVRTLVENGLITDRDIRFFVGYASWTTGQLAEELEHGSWVTAEMDSNYLFSAQRGDLWHKIMEHKGSHFSIIAEMANSPNMN